MSQRMPREPGWYPDSIGNDDAFRWWNGTEWTTAVADTLWAPEPKDPRPYHRPQRPIVPAPAAPRVVEVEEEPPPYRKPLLIGGIAMVIAAALFGGGVWLFGVVDDDPSSKSAAESSGDTKDRAESRARSDPDQSQGGTKDQDGEDSGSGGGNGEKRPDGLGLPRYPEPGEDWLTGHGVVPHSQVRRLITEKKYNGEDDWGAIIVTGELPQGVTPAEEHRQTARRVAQWFGEVGFGDDRQPDVDVMKQGPTLVAGRPAYTFRLRVDYEIDGLSADWDRTTVTVFDLGPGERPGVFLSSVPNTHPGLKDVTDEALSSVSLTKKGQQKG